MFLQQKLRFGGALMILGCLLAAGGEIMNALNPDPLNSSWQLSLGLIVVGTLLLLSGLTTFSSVSPKINGMGFIGTSFMQLGGFLLMVGTIALDWIIIPLLLNLANTIAVSINQPTSQAQGTLNKVITTINNLGGGLLQKLFPKSTPKIAEVHLPQVNGITIVNQALAHQHLPTLDKLQWWGHFCLSGTPLAPGCLILGLALPSDGYTLSPRLLLIVFSLLHLLCQFFPVVPLWGANLTFVGMLLALIWLGVSAWLSTSILIEEEIVEVELPRNQRRVRNG